MSYFAVMEKLRKTLFHILYRPAPSNPAARYVNYFLAAIILVNCAAVALETVPGMFEPHKVFFTTLKAISTAIFAVEYVSRIWVCVEETRYSAPVLGRLKYAVQPLPLLDLLVITTFWAPWDFRFLRIFRLTLLLRVLHLEALDHSYQAVSKAIGRRKHLLVVSFLMMLITAYCFAAHLYMVEHPVQPDKFSSIPETLWWAIVSLTTIGYGDLVPLTPLGKFLTGGIVLIGVGIFALPAAIMTASILDAGMDRDENCSHCGKQL